MLKVLLLSLLLSLPALAQPRETRAIANGFSTDGDIPTIQISIISQTEATALFQEFRSHTEIPFGYPVDGCTIRASAMAAIAERRGIIMAKTYAEGLLQSRTRYPAYPIVKWGWHTAPSVFVRTPPPNSAVQQMIFDPSIGDGPMTVAQWRTAMMAKDPNDPAFVPRVDKVFSGTRFQNRPPVENSHDAVTRLRADPDDERANRELLTLFKSYEINPGSIPQMMERPPDSVE